MGAYIELSGNQVRAFLNTYIKDIESGERFTSLILHLLSETHARPDVDYRAIERKAGQIRRKMDREFPINSNSKKKRGDK